MSYLVGAGSAVALGESRYRAMLLHFPGPNHERQRSRSAQQFRSRGCDPQKVA